MPAGARLVLLVACAALAVVLVLTVIAARRRGGIWGRPSIPLLPLALGKIALFASLAFPPAAALGLDLASLVPVPAPFPVPPAAALGAAVLAVLGTALAGTALATLGARTRVGILDRATSLETRGVYRLGRNPMYVGLFALSLAGVLATGSPLALAFTAVAAAVHHRIVLAEEAFLRARFGAAWDRYAAEVRRYL